MGGNRVQRGVPKPTFDAQGALLLSSRCRGYWGRPGGLWGIFPARAPAHSASGETHKRQLHLSAKVAQLRALRRSGGGGVGGRRTRGSPTGRGGWSAAWAVGREPLARFTWPVFPALGVRSPGLWRGCGPLRWQLLGPMED